MAGSNDEGRNGEARRNVESGMTIQTRHPRAGGDPVGERSILDSRLHGKDIRTSNFGILSSLGISTFVIYKRSVKFEMAAERYKFPA
jgi:hypothetical protein